MDPLSLSVSSLALITAALQVSKAIYHVTHSISSATAELKRLENEVQDLRVVLVSAELLLKSNPENTWHINALSVFNTLLRRLNDKLNQIESFCGEYCDRMPGKRPSFRSVEWSLWGREKSTKLKEELHALHVGFSTSIGTMSASATLQIGFKVDRVEVSMASLHRDVASTTNAIVDQERKATTAFQSIALAQTAMQSLLESKISEIQSDLDENNVNMFLRGQLNSLLPPTAIAVHLSLQQRAMCVPSCPCICHSWRHFKSPSVLERLIGSLVLGCTGIPLMARRCTETRCRVKATYAVRVCYRLPTWSSAHVVQLGVYSRYGAPTAGLSVARIRPHNSSIFALAESGNFGEMKTLFDRGLASPFDVSAQTGDQPLHITATHGFIDASRMLVGYGADPHAWDQSRRNTPHLNAWNMILSANIPQKIMLQMSALFSNVNASFDFPRLHELVLGLKRGSIEAELQKPGCDINAQDSAGNTALQWACLRGDQVTARLLLANHADPNASNHVLGRTALMAACTRPSAPCIELLLEYSVDINAQSSNGLDALIYLVEEDRDPQPLEEIAECARLLVERGISLEPHGKNLVWCLARAARTQLIGAMEIMLEHGAQIDLQNNYGLTALARSVDWSAAHSVRFLLGKGASYTGGEKTDSDGRTILHHLALNPQLDVINALLEANLHGLDPHDRDDEGFTAEDYFSRVDERPVGVTPAFMALVMRLQPRDTEQMTVESDDEEEYFDAEDEVYFDLEDV